MQAQDAEDLQYDTVVERYIREYYHVLRAFPRATVLERDGPGRSGMKIPFEGSS